MQKNQEISKFSNIQTKATLFAVLSSFWNDHLKTQLNVHYAHSYTKKKVNYEIFCYTGINIKQYKPQYTKQVLPSSFHYFTGHWTKDSHLK